MSSWWTNKTAFYSTRLAVIAPTRLPGCNRQWQTSRLKACSQYDTRADVLCCTKLAKHENVHKFAIFGDQMQERNAEECKDRIWVYPCISLRCSERQHECDTMQGFFHIVNRPYASICWSCRYAHGMYRIAENFWWRKLRKFCSFRTTHKSFLLYGIT